MHLALFSVDCGMSRTGAMFLKAVLAPLAYTGFVLPEVMKRFNRLWESAPGADFFENRILPVRCFF